MKTASQIKLEVDRQKELKALKEINDTIEWVELVIGRYIQEGKNCLELYDWDHNVGKYYDKLERILINSKYKVSKKESIINVGTPFKRKEAIETKIVIEWE